MNSIIEKVHTQKTELIDPIAWKQIRAMAETLIKSGAMPQGLENAEQVMIVMQAGYEMGLKPIQSLNSLYIVNGQVTLWGRALTLQFRRHGYRLEYKDGENKATVIATHKDGWKVEESFTLEEAEKSGYTKDRYGKLKFGWREGANRIIKLRYGALNKLAKTQCAEVLGSAVGVTEVYQDAVKQVEVREGRVVEDKPITAAQKRTILALADKSGMSVNEKDIEGMTSGEAKKWIEELLKEGKK